MEKIFLNTYNYEINRFRQKLTPKVGIVADTMRNIFKEPKVDLNIGDYCMDEYSLLYEICSKNITSRAKGHGVCKVGFIANSIEYDFETKRLNYTYGTEISHEIYGEYLDDSRNYTMVGNVVNARYLFKMMRDLYLLYINIQRSSNELAYNYPITDEMYDVFSISKNMFSNYISNKSFDNCIEYVLSKDGDRRAKMYNITNDFYNYLQDKLIIDLGVGVNEDRPYGSLYIPIGIDEEHPYKIKFRVIDNNIICNKDGEFDSVYIGELLCNNLDIIDYDKELYKKYLVYIYENVEKIFYIHNQIIRNIKN